MPASHAPHHRTMLKLGLALVYLTPVAIFAKLAFEVRDGHPVGVDIHVLEYLHRFASPAHDRLAIAITNLGGPQAILLATLALAGILLVLRRRREMAVLLIGVGGAAVINLVLKQIFERPRPSLWVPVLHETDFSFPSGHAMMSSALAFSAIYLLWHTGWRWIALAAGGVYVLAVGLTRVYLGVHYPTDVIGGWAISFIWLVAVARILERSQPAAARPNPKP